MSRFLVIDSDGPRVEIPSGEVYRFKPNDWWSASCNLIHGFRLEIQDLRYLDPVAK